jgi:membrane protein DedA with SNARE-associated domain
MHALIQIWFGWVRDWGYGGIILLMAMESSIFPVPSEIVMPPAAFWAAQGKMNLWGVILSGTFGSWLGASITYWVSQWIGRPLLITFGKFFFVSEDKLSRAERWLSRYEAGGIFFARLLPVIRHLISIPAGIVRMPFKMFSFMTLAGSFLWCTILSFYGKAVIGKNPKLLDNPDELMHFLKSQFLTLFAFVAVLCVLYFIVMKLTSPQPQSSSEKVS